MLKKLQRTLSFHIKTNLTYYILILCGFICGGIVAAACVFGLSDFDSKELGAYFDDFFSGINKTGANSLEIFRLSVSSNLKLYILTALLSMMVIGSPFIPVISVFLGYSFWFTLFFVFKNYALKGALFFALGMLPHQIISFPCHALMLVASMQFSVSLLKEKTDAKKRIYTYLVKMTALFLTTVFSSLLQGYVEPVFIRLISSLFMA